jgi:hypothetical protein
MTRRKNGPAVPLRWQSAPDFRSRGTAAQFVRDHLAAHPEGVERAALARKLTRRKAAAPRTARGIGEILRRLCKRGEIVEVAGVLRLSRPANAGRHD